MSLGRIAAKKMLKKNNKDNTRQTIIEPTHDFFKVKWVEIWNYRDLLYLLVRRDFISKYKQTVLGPAWFILQPLLTTIVFTVIFGKFAKIPLGQVPPILFYLCGLLAWDYFSQCLSGISGSLISNTNLFAKVYFPRLIIPLSLLLSNLMRFTLQLVVFLCFYAYFYFFTPAALFIHPSFAMTLLPIAVLFSALISLGFGLLICSLTVRYRDLQYVVGFTIQLWMYGTPIIYPLSAVPEKWRWIVLMNPMTQILEFYRLVFFGKGDLSFFNVLISLAVTVLFLFAGLYQFNKSEKTFVDVL